MEKPATEKKPDILTEDYKGTGAVISGLGYGVIESKIAIIPGAILGGTAAAIKPEWIDGFDKSVENLVNKSQQPGASLTREVLTGPIHLWQSLTTWCKDVSIKMVDVVYTRLHDGASIAVKHPGISKYAKGIANGSAAAFILAFVLGAFHGASSSNRGEKQFDRAKGEIKTLRDEKEALTTELDTTSKELAKTKAEVTKYAAMNDTTPKAIISNAEHADTVVSRDALAQQL